MATSADPSKCIGRNRSDMKAQRTQHDEADLKEIKSSAKWLNQNLKMDRHIRHPTHCETHKTFARLNVITIHMHFSTIALDFNAKEIGIYVAQKTSVGQQRNPSTCARHGPRQKDGTKQMPKIGNEKMK